MCRICLLCVLVVGVDYYNDDFACGIFYYIRRCASATSTSGDDGEVNSWAASAVYNSKNIYAFLSLKCHKNDNPVAAATTKAFTLLCVNYRVFAI